MNQDDIETESKNKLKRMQNEHRTISAFLTSAERRISRLNNYHDPTIRNAIIVEIISGAIDFGITFGMEMAFAADQENDNILLPEDLAVVNKNREALREKMEKFRDSTDQLFKQLQEWIASPIYSPDHPYGEKMMNESKQHYDSVTKP